MGSNPLLELAIDLIKKTGTCWSVGRAIGVDPASLYRMTQRTRVPSPETLLRVIEYCDPKRHARIMEALDAEK